jgi:MraZ protein
VGNQPHHPEVQHLMEFQFRGQDEYSVDDRGRMILPPSYKPALTENVLIVAGFRGQLWVYPKPVFEQILQKMQETPEEERDGEFEEALGYLLAGQDAKFDPQGRLSIPPFLRRQANITGSAIVRGNGDRVELWNPEKYAQAYEGWVANEHKGGHQALRRSGFRP